MTGRKNSTAKENNFSFDCIIISLASQLIHGKPKMHKQEFLLKCSSLAHRCAINVSGNTDGIKGVCWVPGHSTISTNNRWHLLAKNNVGTNSLCSLIMSNSYHQKLIVKIPVSIYLTSWHYSCRNTWPTGLRNMQEWPPTWVFNVIFTSSPC